MTKYDRPSPSLNALRAFEAAARHESLSKAAAELNVTHAAISRHVRELEAVLRVMLFERTGRGVVVTEAGRTLASDLTEAFEVLTRATNRFARPARRRNRLVVTSDVPFATYWLVPRLGRFTLANPDIDFVLDPSPRLVDFRKEDVDIGIRFGDGNWRNVTAEHLSGANLTVVCTPELLHRFAVKLPADLPPQMLLQEEDRKYWRLWLAAAGLGDRIVPSGPTLLADLALAAAEAGQGFVLADHIIAADSILASRLVAPFDVSIAHTGYHLVHRAEAPLAKTAQIFRAWLMSELARTRAAIQSAVLGHRHGHHGAAAAASGAKRTRKPPTT